MPNLHLCDLDLNKNQLLKAVVHKAGTAPATPEIGQIYYDTGDDTMYVCTAEAPGSGNTAGTWLDLGDNSGDITGVTFIADGGSNLVTASGAVSLDIAGGTGITTAATSGTVTANIDAAQTGITSIYATDLIIGEDSQTAIDFGTANEIDFKVNNANRLTLSASALYPATNNQIDLGTSSLEFKDAFFDGTVLADAFSGDLTGDVDGDITGASGTVTSIGNLTGEVTSTNRATVIAGNVVDEANLKVSNGPTNGYVLSAQSGNTGGLTWVDSAASTQTLTNKTIAASQVTEISNITAGEGAQLENIGGTTISATQWGYLGAATGAITNTDTDVTVDNLKTRLAGGFGSNAVTIGDSDDVVTIGNDLTVTGDLIVSGTTTTLNTANLTVEDNNIVLSSGNTTSAAINGAGITLEGGSGSDATFTYNTTGPKFEMKLGSNYEDLKVDTLHAAALTIPDNAIAVAKIAAGTLPTDVKVNNAHWSGADLSVGNGGTGASNLNHIVQIAGTQTVTGAKTFDENINIAGIVLDGNTITGVNDSSEFDDDDSHIMTSAAILDKFHVLNADTTGNAATATNLVVSTSSVVSLGSIEMGDADDTTIARSAAGRVTIEGQQIATSKSYALAHATTGVAGDTSSANGNKVFTITHGMGNSLNYMVQVIAASGGATVFPCVTRTTSTVVITFNAVVAASAYTALLVKI